MDPPMPATRSHSGRLGLNPNPHVYYPLCFLLFLAMCFFSPTLLIEIIEAQTHKKVRMR